MAVPAPGTPAHTRLVQMVRARRELGKRAATQRYPQWRQNEQLYRAWVNPDQKDKEGKKQYPWARSIVVPITYAVMQTMLAFDVSAFTQRRPVVALDGVGPHDVKPAKVMEQYLHWEWQVRRTLLTLYTWLLDRRRYGIGWLWNTWTQDVGFRTVDEPRTLTLPILGTTVTLGSRRRRETVTRFEGNDAVPVDPYSVWSDPRVPLADFQRGEFIGRTIRRSYSYMQEQAATGFYANVEAIPRAPLARRSPDSDDSDRSRILNLSDEWAVRGDTVDFQERGYVDLDEGVFKIAPRRYELGPGEQPELWWVTLANDATIVRGDPYAFAHMEYPAAVMEASPDGHAWANPGNVEQLQGLQEHTSWLYNSHAENVRKALNDMLLVNPALIELEDLLSPQPGRLLRLTPLGQRTPGAMEQAAKQFPVTDVTSNHLRDLNVNLDLIQRVTAAPENLQGVIAQKDRTLGEQQMAVANASGRLRVEAQLAWVQGMVPWTYQRVQNLQQLLSDRRWLRVVGDYSRALGISRDQPFLHVGPEEIQGSFTYEVIDGTIRANDGMLNVWKEIFVTVAKDPELRQQLELLEIFRTLAMMGGVTNIDDYVRQQQPIPPIAPGGVQVMPDEQVARQAEAGNLVPAGGPPHGPGRNGAPLMPAGPMR
jgi:hypothetical protein